MEIPVATNAFYPRAESVYVQRVGDFICFYEGDVSDTDVARRSTTAQYRIGAKAFTRIVTRLRAGTDTTLRGYGYRGSYREDGVVTWDAPCGARRHVHLDVLEAVVAELAGDL